jgi:transposase
MCFDASAGNGEAAVQAYSQDLRDRVLWALARGERPTAIARRLEVSRVWVYRARGREQQKGQRTSFQIGGHRRSRVAAREAVLRAWIEKEPGLSLVELCQRLVEQGISIKTGALWHQNGVLPSKKTLHASEQERENVQQARLACQQALPTMAVEKLVFIDEAWTSTSMTRRYGRAPRGKRCLDSAPHGHWETTTSVGALRWSRLIAPTVTDGPMDGETFLAFVRLWRCPTLQPGDTVILDNLSSHKVARVEQAILTTGAAVRFLPPYPPDLNPIEKFFSVWLRQVLEFLHLLGANQLRTWITGNHPRRFRASPPESADLYPYLCLDTGGVSQP